jgi:OmcA/MtrC family decaheme c-type cytochrome
MSVVGTKAYDRATNTCTFTKTGLSPAVATAMQAAGIVQIYGVDEILETDPAKHLSSGKYPFAGVLKVGAVDYSSAANVSGCESCHTQPFLKHTYIYGKVTENATGTEVTEFYTCKGCHYDSRGGHVETWQILKDNPARAAEIEAGSPLTDAERAKYGYKATLMNDVHMSHAMEFAYPQSMKNCVTCHAGKLQIALADDKFKAETCRSCHSVDGLRNLMSGAAFNHSSMLDNPGLTDCTICHKAAGGAAPSFATIHKGGYDEKIYTTAGVRYSDTFKVTIDSTSVAANKLTVKFSATGALEGMSAASITPTVLIGLYGYDSKDFLVAAHGTNADGKRNLEYVWDGTATNNPTNRFTQVGKTTAGGTTTWELQADLSLWADKIADGSIKRAEVAVMPELKNANSVILGLDAPSRTFDLTRNAFDDAFFSNIVKVANTAGPNGITGCNTCHDQLATTFHSGNRGGNIKVCRICHEVSNGGAHLELQSRSIDSYVHAIHSFQAFDPGNIDFGDPVESMEYQHHIGSSFPRFGILNCESCHNAGMYDVPNQAKSMPGVLSGTDAVAGRAIGSLPPSVTGPAVRACGGCHRAQVINADDAAGLTVLTQHFRTFGYVIDTTTAEATALWESVVAKIMGVFQ